MLAPGPFRAEHMPSKSRYELSDGHPIYCSPTKAQGGRASVVGAHVLDSDPAVRNTAMDAGYEQSPDNLRAPDLSVNLPDGPDVGWVKGVPPLAVEYADSGQDEKELKAKIAEFLAGGTQLIWVVRLTGPRRVQVYESGKPRRDAKPGELLHAPGILQNPVPVEALYDRDASWAATFRNLLARHGYDSLDDVLKEGREEGRKEGEVRGARTALTAMLGHRGLYPTDGQLKRIADCGDAGRLIDWTLLVAGGAELESLFGD